MTTTFDLERRLRLPAPDEPAILPPLVLPTDTASLGRAGRGLRSPLARQLQPAWLLVALLAAVAWAIAAGALREQPDPTPLGLACRLDMGPVPGVMCPSLVIPDGWHTLAAGQIMPGDFTEPGLGYEIVQLVIASDLIGACPTTPGPMPAAVPSGDAVEVPLPTRDPGLVCLRDAPLPDNAVRVEALQGMRILGMDDQGGGIPDTSEPTAAAGWTERVADRPARLTITPGSGAAGEPAETLTWDVLFPGSVDHVLRIRADIAGPDVARGRDAVRSIIDSITFDRPQLPPDDVAADDVLRRVLDSLERQGREEGTDFYACFPRTPGSAAGTINRTFSGPIGPLDVTCTSAISPSAAGWRIVLDVTWPPTPAHAGDTIRTEFFATGAMLDDRMPEYTGGYQTSLAGRAMPPEGSHLWYPGGDRALPAPLEGPLDIPPGSIVEILPPGAWPGQRDQLPDGPAPSAVGMHFLVLGEPEVVDGDPWFPVFGRQDQFFEVQWIRGVRDGRPLLAVVTPDCPAGPPTVGELTWLIPGERAACFGATKLTLDRVVLVGGEAGPFECPDNEGQFGPCATGAPDWLTRPAEWSLYDESGPSGPYPPLWVWLHPSAGEPPPGELLRVTGRFQHPDATGCRWPADGSAGPIAQQPELGDVACGLRFVVTGFEPAG